MESKPSPAAEGLRVRRKAGSGPAEPSEGTEKGTTTGTTPSSSTTTQDVSAQVAAVRAQVAVAHARVAAVRTQVTAVHAQVAAAQVYDMLSVLLFFRFVNALCVRTFFQPDEYFQALEPAWDMAFGNNSGAWMTWEWQRQLRSSLHPAIFALAYRAVEGVMSALSLFPPFKALMLVALPGALQSVFAALGDFFTWKLAMDIYGRESNAPWAALWMTVLNPWQWYCSTRTFSNSLETTLTIAALCYWPWEVLGDAKASKELPPFQQKGVVASLRISLVLAAIAVLLRPTNLLIWLCVLGLSLGKLARAGTSTLLVLVREIAICGLAVLAVSVASDRLYFGFWTFPPYQWLYFNISASLAVFYGHMPWHYYLSQGVPLLTTTFLPFALVGLYKAASSANGPSALQSNTLNTLALAALSMITSLSLIAHKEVRFIYPLLPILHILAAPYITTFFTSPNPQPPSPANSAPLALRHKFTLANLLSLNLLIAGYLSLLHQPAPISVLSFLRSDFERLHPDALSIVPQTPENEKELFALFLTPCHSTPWRSHLVYPALRARALTCEPPLHTAPNSPERAAYLDEADRFYLPSPAGWDGKEGRYGMRFLAEELFPLVGGGGSKRGGEVPRYIVGFEGIEPVLQEFFGSGKDEEDDRGALGWGMGVKLRRVWSAWNGAFNEDWRRTGRLVVWDTGVYEGGLRAEDLEEEREREL